MKKLLKYLRPFLAESILGPFFKLIEALLELFVPLIVAAIIDKGIAENNTPFIFKMSGLLVLLALFGIIFSVTAQYFAAKSAVGFSTEVRSRLFSHIQKLSYTQLDTIGSSTLITRLTGDINQVQSGVNLTLRLLLRSPFVVFGAMIMAFTVDVNAALVFVVTIPILSVVVFTIMALSMPLYKKVQSSLDKVLEKTRENLSGTRVIRAFSKEQEETEAFCSKNDVLCNFQIVAAKISSFMNPLTFVLINISIVFLIYIGAIRVNSGIISKGQVVALYNYMSQILIELIKLANLIINITKSIASGNRIQSVLEIVPENNSGYVKKFEDCQYSVEFKNVSLAYNKNSDYSLSNINISIKRGSTVGVIGSTGSGKSSLINLIPCFYTATKGEVKVYGDNVQNYDKNFLISNIGIVPQNAVLFKGTVRENMKIGKPNATDEEIIEALKVAQSLKVVMDKPGGLDFLVEQGGKNLSGGQRQRLTIARAIVKKPKILILDDSSSALDYATDSALRKSIRNTDFNPTVIVVSQRTSSVKSADCIIVMEDGEIAGIGTDNHLMETCEVYREINNSQHKEGDSKNV